MKGKENGLIWSKRMPPPQMYNGITSNFLFYETCLNIGRHIFPASLEVQKMISLLIIIASNFKKTFSVPGYDILSCNFS
jgi:hypothetical protein